MLRPFYLINLKVNLVGNTMPIRRTFRRKAKNGLVKADGGLWEVKKDGEPCSGKVVSKINVANLVAFK